MNERRIADLSVHAVGLGCMPLSDHAMTAERPRALATIHAALDAGMTLLDTADIYAPDGAHFGHNEELVAEALRTWGGSSADRERVVVVTKGGITREAGPHGDRWGRAGAPGQLAEAVRASARRLGVDVIDLYLFHRFDPQVPLNDQLTGLAAVKADGVARRIGLSNVDLAQLDRALELLGGPDDGGIVAVQNEFSPRYRGDADVLDRCTERGLAFMAWSPLGGSARAGDVDDRYAAFADVAQAHAASPQQVALAWLLGLSPSMIAIPGCTRPTTARSSAAAAELELTAEEQERLSQTQPEEISAFPDRVPAPPM